MKVVGIGAGGHAKVIIGILRSRGGFEIVALVDQDPGLWGSEVLGVTVQGDDSRLHGFHESGISHVFIGVGGVEDNEPRQRLFEQALGLGFEVVSAVHPGAIVSPYATIGRGATIMAGVVINPAAVLGVDVIVNTGSIVEHDCLIGDHAHIATGARLAGGVSVEDGAHVGLGASILQGITIGRNAVVGAGAVVVKDVPPYAVVRGVPAVISGFKYRR